MNPETASKLMEQFPEMQEFVAYIKTQAKSLHNLSEITMTGPVEVAVEVKARQKASEILLAILDPLINKQEMDRGIDEDYVV